MLPTRLVRVAVVALAVVAVACGDITKPKATYPNVLSNYTIYGLTGAPATAPTAISFLGGTTIANASFLFDVAFDLDATGHPVVYPVRSLASALAGTAKRVGMQTVSGSFDAVSTVPTTGYDTVNAKTINPGTVLAVELRDPNICFSYSLVTSQFIYAKLVVDSVNAATKKLYIRTVVDANCGYFSVYPDSVPTH
ncbi:MAG: hypothetical protein ABIY52_12420 [Gemmatimonadaceae bacterium]